MWATDTRSATFGPDGGRGTYRFRARMRRLGTGGVERLVATPTAIEVALSSDPAYAFVTSKNPVQSALAPSPDPAMNCSTISRAISSENCTGGDFMK